MLTPAVWVIAAEKTRIYGLWRVRVRTDEGREFEGWGPSEAEATYRARRQARGDLAASQPQP